MSALTSSQVKRRATELGFLACGVTDPSPIPTSHADRLDDWLAKGYAGTMRYLHRQAKRRKDPRLIVPEARSVVMVLDNYYTPDTNQSAPRIAKYARGEDYHRATKRRIDALATLLLEHGALVARTYTDAGPVPERELAQRAGLGWIGKNTMLIRPGAGSFFFIGAIFTDLTLAIDAPFELDRCGSCTRCLDACPTNALVEPHLLDATRCISYLTIEHKGDIPEAIVPKLEGWAFGCDICNDVCPWNERFATPTPHAEFQTRADVEGADLDFFETMTEATFDRRFADTPLERPGLDGMRRNFRALSALQR